MAENTVNIDCPLCGTTEYSEIKKFADGVLVGECDSCGAMYTPVRHLTPDGLFATSDQKLLKFSYGPIMSKRVRHFRYTTFKAYLTLVKKYTTGKRHLDVGCAHGFFPSISREDGFEVAGVEPGPGMAQFAKEQLGLEIFEGALSKVDLGGRKWDLITFTDSLEYFADPVGDLKKLVDTNLESGGVVFIKVPNGSYFRFRHWVQTRLKFGMGMEDAFTPSMRVVHYDNKSIKSLAEQIGLEPIKVNYFRPINSPDWLKHTGLWLEMAGPWWMNWKSKLFRGLLHVLGKVEYALIRKNHFSQSVYVLGRKTS